MQHAWEERAYVDKLLAIFRTKDEGTIRATAQAIDTKSARRQRGKIMNSEALAKVPNHPSTSSG